MGILDYGWPCIIAALECFLGAALSALFCAASPTFAVPIMTSRIVLRSSVSCSAW